MSADFAFDARGTSETSASEGDHGAEPSPSGCARRGEATRARSTDATATDGEAGSSRAQDE